jgi:uncharacterized membrane protein
VSETLNRCVDVAAVVNIAADGIGSVVVSWVAIHTAFTLRNAQFYSSGAPGGIDFNRPEPPAYVDFAYLAFTVARIGLTVARAVLTTCCSFGATVRWARCIRSLIVG